MRRAIDASRAFTELLAAHQAEALARLNDIIFACSAEIEAVQKEAKALVHMIEDHSKATVGRLVDLRSRVNRLAQYVAEGGAGPEQAADDLNRQKAVEAKAFWGRLTKADKHALSSNLDAWKAQALKIDALPEEGTNDAADR